MTKNNIEIVEELPNGKMIIKIVREMEEGKNPIVKYALANNESIINVFDSNGNLAGIQFFDKYILNENGDVIIGIKKAGKEYLERVLAHYDLSETRIKVTEVPGGPFNIGPYAKPYYEYTYPTKTIEDIVDEKYSFNYGLINRDGILAIYPSYDEISFGNEDTCIVGTLYGKDTLKYGYVDILTGTNITPICFDVARKFFSNRAAVKYNRRYGYIDRNKILENPRNNEEYAENLAPMFYSARDFQNGEAIVCLIPGTHLTSSIKVKMDTDGNMVGSVPPFRKRLIMK